MPNNNNKKGWTAIVFGGIGVVAVTMLASASFGGGELRNQVEVNRADIRKVENNYKSIDNRLRDLQNRLARIEGQMKSERISHENR